MSLSLDSESWTYTHVVFSFCREPQDANNSVHIKVDLFFSFLKSEPVLAIKMKTLVVRHDYHGCAGKQLLLQRQRNNDVPENARGNVFFSRFDKTQICLSLRNRKSNDTVGELDTLDATFTGNTYISFDCPVYTEITLRTLDFVAIACLH